jgi:PAS domain S-box-containing protein
MKTKPNDPADQWLVGQEPQLLRSLIDHLPTNLVLKDREGRVTFGNATYLKTMGKRLEEVIGKTDSDLFPEELAREYRQDDLRVMDTGAVFEDVEKHRTSKGEELYAQVMKSPLRDARGNITGVQVLFWDVTERECMRQELARERDRLRQTQSELERRVAERTAEFTRANAALREQIVERERAEQQWRDSQSLYQSLVQSLPMNVLRKDREGRFTFGNTLALQTMGKTLEELHGRTDFDFFPEPLANKYRRDDCRVMQTGEVFEDVEKHHTPQGRDLFVQVLKTPVRDAKGEITGVQVLFWDVTDREQAKQELAYEEEQFRAFLENIPDNVYFKDRQSRFVRISRALAERFHLTEAALVKGKSDFDFFTEEHARPAFEDEQEIMRTGQAVIAKLEKEVYPDGRVTWALTTKMPWRDRQGTIIGTFGMSKDVTDVKRTEEALAQASSQLQTLLDHVPDRIYFKDLQSRFIRCSKAVVEPLGMKNADEAIGKSDFDFFQEEHARPAFADEQRIIRTGEPVIAKEEKEVWQDGQVTWVLTNKLPLRDGEGKIIGTFGISKDITQLKLAEERIEQVHRQLLETSRRAGMADVATGVLHNVGNVLNSINVSTNLLVEQVKASRVHSAAKLADLFEEHAADLGQFLTEDERGRQVPTYLRQLADRLREEQAGWLREFESLARNVDHIKEIVAMQQSYARVSGVAETVPVRELVEDALKMHSGAYLRHAVNLVREYEEVPPITVDKHKVLQILVNLLHNAKYACDEGGPAEKRVAVRIAPAAGDRVKIEVADNGIGIAPENLTRIFGHGFTTRPSGHGFGLHSGALAAKELGGTLTASSPGPGQGAAFALELPQVPPENHG